MLGNLPDSIIALASTFESFGTSDFCRSQAEPRKEMETAEPKAG